MIPNNATRMQSLVTISFFLLLIVLFTSISAIADEKANTVSGDDLSSWRLVKDVNGIRIYTKKTESGYKEVNATITVSASPIDLLTLLDNIAIADQWIDNCQKVQLIDSPSANERVVHSFFYAPWPVKNRDMVTHSKTVFEESGVVKIIVSDYSARYPAADDDYVRMENVRGVWTMQPIDDEKMQVSYSGYGEPAGGLPIWLANSLVKSSTYNTFEKMRKLLESN